MYLLDVSIRYLKYFCVVFFLFFLFVYAVSFIAMLQSPSLMVLFLFHLLGLVACVYRSESESGGHEHRIPSFQVHLSLAILMVGQGHTLSYFVS